MSAEVRLTTIARDRGRIGCIGFGGPPTHIALLRRLCVRARKWFAASEFEDSITAGPPPAALSERECAVRVLHYGHDRTQADLARLLGISQMSVSRINSFGRPINARVAALSFIRFE
ncbi:chromate transporter [Nocardia sp. NPDC088792]|uniref:chromate transporter n=1 Tax=Nocardia sp. NPDC088792 TaxID=3364332 RepID=UPI003802B724